MARFPLLVREPGSGTRLAVERAFADAGVYPTNTIELGANESVKQGVIEGLGIAALSRGTVALELRRGYLTELAVPPFPIMRFWHVVWPAEKRPSLAAKAFLELLNRPEQAART